MGSILIGPKYIYSEHVWRRLLISSFACIYVEFHQSLHGLIFSLGDLLPTDSLQDFDRLDCTFAVAKICVDISSAHASLS
jgi:hypothetical protein